MKVMAAGGARDMRAVWFEGGRLKLIDQRKLPLSLEIVETADWRRATEMIRDMTVRGAPAIGITAAYAMALALRSGEDPASAARHVKSARPTAYDLFYAVDRIAEAFAAGDDVLGAADGYAEETVEKCRAIGRHGAALIADGMKVMTHCNAGALATGDWGTALAPMRVAHAEGRRFLVYVSETRPRLQGMQLTAWELLQEGIEHAIIPDSASARYMGDGVGLVITGADRIAANGDFANKIGTLDKAILASHFGVPFYVAAPISTFDPKAEDGKAIPIECRAEEEMTCLGGQRLAPAGSRALNPAFDVTPGALVTGFITEYGIISPDDLGRATSPRRGPGPWRR
ncbi:MAG: S-methyl-5-thioribose-1-phosphate isomerase [Kiritimatiellae bacterium]|nr:S-methyl-5-thioribose-1-phosphate isomerase [Kiritimatiellia bacterium]